MDAKKKKRLEAGGWRVGTVEEFLALSEAEMALIDMHIRLCDEIKRRLQAARMSQAELARHLETSASRLSNMLAGKQVSTDALVRALFVLGATSREIGKVIGGATTKGRARRRAA
jgi:predicted XRE-type DNA-binding protein